MPFEASGSPAPDPAPDPALEPLPAERRWGRELPAALALDPAALSEGSLPEAPLPGAAPGFFRARLALCKAFLTYIGPRDLWSALYSIFFVLTASLWFGRIPKMPIAFLVCLPFIYLSLLGAALLFLAWLRDRCVGNPRGRLLNSLLGPESFPALRCRQDGSRLLRASFAVGFYLFLGLLYLAAGPAEDPAGWLLMPCLLVGMAAIFSLNQKALEGASGGGFLRGFRKTLLRRALGMLLLGLSIFMLFQFLILPLRKLLLGG